MKRLRRMIHRLFESDASRVNRRAVTAQIRSINRIAGGTHD